MNEITKIIKYIFVTIHFNQMHPISILLFLFVAVRAVTENEIFCERGLSDCPILQEFSFPESEEAMNLACTKGISYFNCLRRYFVICSNRDTNKIKEFDGILNKLHALCDEENDLHKGLAQHVGCIKDVLLNFNVSCEKLAVEIRDLSGFKNVVKNEDYIKFGCLRRMAEVSCILVKIGQSCGTSAEENFLDAVKVIEERNEFCPGLAFQEAADLIQTLEIEEEIKIQFQKLMEVIE